LAAAVVALALALVLAPAAARPDKEMREKFYGTLVTNGTHNATGDGSIAEMFGRVLDKEFADSDTPDGTNLDLHRTGFAREAFGFLGESFLVAQYELNWTAMARPRISHGLISCSICCTVLRPVLLVW
jgi:hypothetical protein